MSSADFIRMRLMSNSNLWCAKCNNVFDEGIKICNCKEPDVIYFKEYLKKLEANNETKH